MAPARVLVTPIRIHDLQWQRPVHLTHRVRRVQTDIFVDLSSIIATKACRGRLGGIYVKLESLAGDNEVVSYQGPCASSLSYHTAPT